MSELRITPDRTAAHCRSCGSTDLTVFLSLGKILESVPPEELVGDDYPYISTFTDSMLKHSEANVKERLAERKLGANSLVVELASNDGYLLQYYKAAGVPVLGFVF